MLQSLQISLLVLTSLTSRAQKVVLTSSLWTFRGGIWAGKALNIGSNHYSRGHRGQDQTLQPVGQTLQCREGLSTLLQGTGQNCFFGSQPPRSSASSALWGPNLLACENCHNSIPITDSVLMTDLPVRPRAESRIKCERILFISFAGKKKKFSGVYISRQG